MSEQWVDQFLDVGIDASLLYGAEVEPTTAAPVQPVVQPSAEVQAEVLTEEEYQRAKRRRQAQERLDAESAAPMRRLGHRSIGDAIDDAMEEIALRRHYGSHQLSVGIPSVDKMLQGSIAPKTLTLVAAATSAGKTAIMAQLTIAFASQGFPVLHAVLEDDPTDATMRMLAQLSGGDVGAIRNGMRDRQGAQLPIPEALFDARDRLRSLGISQLYQPGTVEEVSLEAAAWWGEHRGQAPFGVLMVDQLGHIMPSERALFHRRFPHMPPPPKFDDSEKMLHWQTKVLRMVAVKQGLVVVLAHQTNEASAEWEPPTERSIRGSRAITHESDNILIPWRPTRIRNETRGNGDPAWVENEEGRAWICCVKGRRGVKFQQEVKWLGEQQRYADLDTMARSIWEPPAAPSAEAMEGMMRLLAARTQHEAKRAAVTAKANDEPVQLSLDDAPSVEVEAVEVPELVATPGASWPRPWEPPARQQEQPTPSAARRAIEDARTLVANPPWF